VIHYEGLIISFGVVEGGCLIHTTSGIYLVPIEGTVVKKSLLMAFSQLNNKSPITKKSKRNDEEEEEEEEEGNRKKRVKIL
jgi:hypothetical protein